MNKRNISLALIFVISIVFSIYTIVKPIPPKTQPKLLQEAIQAQTQFHQLSINHTRQFNYLKENNAFLIKQIEQDKMQIQMAKQQAVFLRNIIEQHIKSANLKK
jgi:hypothetical protein